MGRFRYYDQLRPAEREIYRRSDQIVAIELDEPERLLPRVAALEAALASSERPRVEAAAQSLIDALTDALATHRAVAEGPLAEQVVAASAMLVRALRAGGTVYWVGNGGSAADAQHLAAELEMVAGTCAAQHPALRRGDDLDAEVVELEAIVRHACPRDRRDCPARGEPLSGRPQC